LGREVEFLGIGGERKALGKLSFREQEVCRAL
jgi:hypothetical protein